MLGCWRRLMARVCVGAAGVAGVLVYTQFVPTLCVCLSAYTHTVLVPVPPLCVCVRACVRACVCVCAGGHPGTHRGGGGWRLGGWVAGW